MTPETAYVLFVIVLISAVATGLIVFLTRKPKQKRPHWRVRDGKADRALDETDEGKLFKTVVLKNTCPDCGGQGFYAGPCGGMSQNIFCKNRECRSGFNVTQFDSDNGTVDRISKGSLERYPPKETIQ